MEPVPGEENNATTKVDVLSEVDAAQQVEVVMFWVGAGIAAILLTLLLTELPTTNTAPSPEVASWRKMARIHKHLSKINKPAIKTIQSVDGDFIDCVEKTLQPAFDHLTLLNHSLETPPDYIPMDVTTKLAFASNEAHGLQLWHQSGHCPIGTVAIRRTKLRDVLHGNNFEGYKKKKHGLASTVQPRHLQDMTDTDYDNNHNHEHAVSYMQEELYYGAQSTMNVWRPNVEVPSEFSLAQMWLLAGSFTTDLNSIEAGWQVSPELYGDHNPRLFTYWTADAYQATGCYNLLCSGFVQTSNEIALGAAITPVSTPNGSQYDIRILIWKDPIKGNWWMQFGDQHLVGYWPASIFTHLANSATVLEWGGEVINTQPEGHHSATTMGSGQFAEKGFAQASYVRNIKYVDANNVLQTPVGMPTIAEHPNCYTIQSSVNKEWGAYFYYGGPGQNSNCP